jgi:hypothetical protein
MHAIRIMKRKKIHLKVVTALFLKAITSSSPSPTAITAKPKLLISTVLTVLLFRSDRITMVDAVAVVD